MNRQFLLAARPKGWVKESDFEYQESEIPQPAEGEVLVKTEYISIDPSMRGQMENRADYVAPLQLGDVMRANGIGRRRHSEDRCAFFEQSEHSGLTNAIRCTGNDCLHFKKTPRVIHESP